MMNYGLTYYSTFFNSIEINSSFFKVPQALTMAKWAASVSENFKFTFKLWKAITQSKGVNFKKEDVAAFFTSISSVREKKGGLLILFPPGLDTINIFQINQFLSYRLDADDADFIYIRFHGPTGNYKDDHVEDFLNEYATLSGQVQAELFV